MTSTIIDPWHEFGNGIKAWEHARGPGQRMRELLGGGAARESPGGAVAHGLLGAVHLSDTGAPRITWRRRLRRVARGR